MADWKLSQLPVTTAVQQSDLVPLLRQADTVTLPAGPGGSDKVATVYNLTAGALGNHLKLALPSGLATGTTDVTGATDQATLSAAISQGATVLMAPGQWWVNAPLVLPAYSKLKALNGNILDSSGAGGVVVNRAAGWAQGSAPQNGMIVPDGLECGVEGVSIHCQWPSGLGVSGIFGNNADNFKGRDIAVMGGAEYGFTFSGGLAWRLQRCMATQCYSHGFNGIPTDSDYVDCIGSANTGDGFLVKNPINSRLIGCRAEWNTGYGYEVTGDNTATGGGALTGCSTDRNVESGLIVNGPTGSWPLLVSELVLRRDGSNGTSAGLLVTATTTTPVIIAGLTVFPGYNDNGTGTEGPVTGVSVQAGATYVAISTALVHAVTTAVSGTITQARSVATRTGSWSAPSAVSVLADTA